MGSTILTSPLATVTQKVNPVIRAWANQYLVEIIPSGSFAKGTAVSSGTDVDLLVSLSSTTPATLRDTYNSLAHTLRGAGLAPRLQNVSIGISVGTYSVDIVPAKRQNQFSNNHSLFSRRTGSWVQTNIGQHITTVKNSGRLEEIKALKIWRNQHQLNFPSFYLELITMRACHGRMKGALAANVDRTFAYIRDNIQLTAIMDPANTNNRISDDLTNAQKLTLRNAAAAAAAATNWNQVLK